ncbi:unnamed protein product [Rotaria sordida]|uniref:Uncharacterized protein n=1 Tax=Rotaria sordida TaxID=392033 RepID=A0A814HCA9_9BILA|nr:unnamed protein product [Rotaria sordida]CAF1007560.1 unnamed protein product [Rotaria sordida]
MPNLTSYHAPPIHLNRELPKTYCDLIRHEIDYNHFLRTRITNIQSSLSFTNKKHLTKTMNTQRHRKYFDHNQRLFHIYQRNLQLCKKILQIWTNNSKQKGGVDCHNENYKKQTKISHFRLQQKQWKDNIESENKRLIRSVIYHRKKYQPVHDRYTAYKAFQYHLKLLKAMSQYPKYNINTNISLQTQCQTLPFSYKFHRQKPKIIKMKFNKPIKHQEIQTNKYIENILQQTMNNAIYIYNQPLPSAFNRIKSSYSADSQWLKPHFKNHLELFRSFSCRQLLEPWRNTKQQSGPLGSYTINDKMINEKYHVFDSYNNTQKLKQKQLRKETNK